MPLSSGLTRPALCISTTNTTSRPQSQAWVAGNPPHTSPHYPAAAVGYGGYDAPGGNGSTGSDEAEDEVDADAAEASEPEPGPEEPTAADLGVPVSSVTSVDAATALRVEGQDATPLCRLVLSGLVPQIVCLLL